MKVSIKKARFMVWELRLDDRPAATARSVRGIERRVRIMHMLSEMSGKGVEGNL